MPTQIKYIDILAHAFYYTLKINSTHKYLSFKAIATYGKYVANLLTEWHQQVELNIDKEETEKMLYEEIALFRVDEHGITVRENITPTIIEERYFQESPSIFEVAFRNDKAIYILEKELGIK